MATTYQHMTTAQMAWNNGVLTQKILGLEAENEELRQQVKQLHDKETARLEKRRERERGRYAARHSAQINRESVPMPAYTPKRDPSYTAESVEEEIRITSEIDAGLLKSSAAKGGVSWNRGTRHHPGNSEVQLVLSYLRANPRQSRQQVCEGTGLDYERSKFILRELDKQGIVQGIETE